MHSRSRQRGILLCLAWLSAATAACGRASTRGSELTGAPTPAPPALAIGSEAARLRYDVTLASDGESLDVVAELDVEAARWDVDPGAGEFVSDVQLWDQGRWAPVPRDGTGFRGDRCGDPPCRVRYSYRLADAAEELDDIEVAALSAGAILSPPSAWLLRPDDRASTPFAFRMSTPPPFDFVSGIWLAPSSGQTREDVSPDTYESDAAYLFRAPYSAFGEFSLHRMKLTGGVLDVAISTRAPSLDESATLDWLRGSAESLVSYYGRFPIERVSIIVLPTPGRRIRGRQMGGGGASIVLHVGEKNDRASYARDWIAAHEMVHLAVPTLSRRHLWLSEGLASYVEPLARASVNQLSDEKVWRDLVLGLPKGQPRQGDRGLDHTPTWGRTYWGGALFAFVADVEIRKRTDGEKSLRDALRSALAEGADTGEWWSVPRFMQAADRGTGTAVLTELYARWANTPETVALGPLFEELGVHLQGKTVRFDDDAPLAELRREMTRR